MSAGAKYVVAVVTVFVVLVLAVALSLALSEQAISRNDGQWCDTLSLLTSKPVPPPSDPKANPSRAADYTLYKDFVHLKAVFGCR